MEAQCVWMLPWMALLRTWPLSCQTRLFFQSHSLYVIFLDERSSRKQSPPPSLLLETHTWPDRNDGTQKGWEKCGLSTLNIDLKFFLYLPDRRFSLHPVSGAVESGGSFSGSALEATRCSNI